MASCEIEVDHKRSSNKHRQTNRGETHIACGSNAEPLTRRLDERHRHYRAASVECTRSQEVAAISCFHHRESKQGSRRILEDLTTKKNTGFSQSDSKARLAFSTTGFRMDAP